MKHYTRRAYVDTQPGNFDEYKRQTKVEAGEKGWEYEEIQGSTALLVRLLDRACDSDDFLVVPLSRPSGRPTMIRSSIWRDGRTQSTTHSHNKIEAEPGPALMHTEAPVPESPRRKRSNHLEQQAPKVEPPGACMFHTVDSRSHETLPRSLLLCRQVT